MDMTINHIQESLALLDGEEKVQVPSTLNGSGQGWTF